MARCLRVLLLHRIPAAITRNIGPGVLTVTIQAGRQICAIDRQACQACASGMDHPQPVVTEITAARVGETMVPNSKEQGLLGDGPDLHDGIGLAAIDGELRPSQSWLDGDLTGAAACIGTRAVSNKYVCSIIAAIEILECSRLGSHHRDPVAEGLMEALVEIKDSKGVRRNVGVISGQVEVF